MAWSSENFLHGTLALSCCLQAPLAKMPKRKRPNVAESLKLRSAPIERSELKQVYDCQTMSFGPLWSTPVTLEQLEAWHEDSGATFIGLFGDQWTLANLRHDESLDAVFESHRVDGTCYEHWRQILDITLEKSRPSGYELIGFASCTRRRIPGDDWLDQSGQVQWHVCASSVPCYVNAIAVVPSYDFLHQRFLDHIVEVLPADTTEVLMRTRPLKLHTDSYAGLNFDIGSVTSGGRGHEPVQVRRYRYPGRVRGQKVKETVVSRAGSSERGFVTTIKRTVTG